ncbi:MAG TPA: ABC transporter ATP-binding protein [Elusimicrobiota bacterium]|nr:ABC transporter ATP-binding protein [Elusimicrobiota bacterium]
MTRDSLVRIEHLDIDYRQHGVWVPVVRDVSFELREREMVSLVGESGCGKTTLALSILRLLPERESAVRGGRILFDGSDVLRMDPDGLRSLRGGRISMIFQDPFSSLNPVLTVGEQVEEVLECHEGRRDPARVKSLLERVVLPDPSRIYSSFPHQLSGGQRQRVMIAMAIASSPKLLIADEPTTALDVTVQKEILDLLTRLQDELGMSVLLITHNLGLVAERSHRLAVMYSGRLVESGETAAVLASPRHPYTQGLIQSLPRIRRTGSRLPMLPGQPPELSRIPSGCAFHPRCAKVFAPCSREIPPLKKMGSSPDSDEAVACHLFGGPAS